MKAGERGKRAAGRIAFVSCNETRWGGSEELWARTAASMARAGYAVLVAKPNILATHPLLAELRRRGCRMRDLARFPLLPKRAFSLMARISRNASLFFQMVTLWCVLRLYRPDLVVLSQGGNWDGFLYGMVLRRLRLRYVVIAQKATELYWPSDWMRPHCKALYAEAQVAYFVSHHNHRLTEEQIGTAIPHGQVVSNPFLTDWNRAQPWPDTEDGVMRFACVGRLYPMEKGQDVLLRVLAQPQWRNRPIEVSFFGAGDRIEGLREMAAFLGVTSVRFPGFVDDLDEIWRWHHALILPTRAEGMPLVVIETMLAGRVVITTDIGGSAEICSDGATGFIASSPDIRTLSETMEQAWHRREEWSSIGAAAARAIRELVPPDPAVALAKLLDELIAPSSAEAGPVGVDTDQRLPHAATG